MWTIGHTIALALAGVVLMARKAPARASATRPADLSGGTGHGRPQDAMPSAEVRAILEQYADQYGLARAFLFAHAAHESRFRPRVGLDTRAGGAPEGAQAERSIGLCGVNINPDRPVGRERLARIAATIGTENDAAAVEWLRDPRNNVRFFCQYIAVPSARRADAEGFRHFEKWVQVRVWMASTGYSKDHGPGVEYAEKFRPTLARWTADYPQLGEV